MMDRRETLKTLMVGSIAAGTTLSVSGCKDESPTLAVVSDDKALYGRTPSEIAWDEKLSTETFLTDKELNTIAVLCDIILPATPNAGSASEANVPEFVDLIVKDLPSHQLPIRGGLMWLDGESQRRYNKIFVDCTATEQTDIIDDIAYPDTEGAKLDMGPGIKFFDRMRNLTLSGYYTTKMGFDDLGYKGNVPNIWDGVPEDVLAKHDVDYDPVWIAKCVDQDKREVTAEWDDQGNLLT